MLKTLVEKTLTSKNAWNKIQSNGSFASLSRQILQTRAVFHISHVPQRSFTGVRYFTENQGERRERGNRERRQAPELTTTLVLVRGLPWERYNNEDIASLFSPVQPKSINIMKNYGEDKPSGLIFVEFNSIDDVKTVLRATRNIAVDGRNVFIRPAPQQELTDATNDSKIPSKVVCIRRLPFSFTAEDVKGLLQGFNPESVVCENGQAYVRFKTQEEREQALTADITFKERKLPISPSSEYDLKRNLANPSKVIRVRGAPNGATEEEIRNFFKNQNVIRVNFTSRESVSGRVMPGDIFVEFATSDDAAHAISLDRQNLGDRYLRISKSSSKERRIKMSPRPEQNEESTEQ